MVFERVCNVADVCSIKQVAVVDAVVMKLAEGDHEFATNEHKGQINVSNKLKMNILVLVSIIPG